jgi:hypothetical protein
MFDVFYIGTKPDLFAHEQQVKTIEQAQQQSRTRFFWLVSYLVDYTGFDFLYEPVPWQSEYTHTWPNQHHEYSGTYLVPAVGEIKYYFHSRIVPNKCRPTSFHSLTDAEFDFTWAPHPHDPPYIYVFGNQWYSANIMPTVEYHTPGATDRKYMDLPRAKLPVKHIQHWHTLVDCEWDYSWVPDPGDPPLIYVFGNQWWSAEKMPTVEYHVPGATDRKYMSWPRAKLLSDITHWTVPDTIDWATVDYSWIPDPGDSPYICQFGTQWQRTGGPVYTVPGATEVKYILAPRSIKITTDSYWTVPEGADTDSFDWTWHPDATESAYIYQFGTQHQRTGGPMYKVPGATEVKYVEQIKIKIDSKSAVIVEIDHLDGNTKQIPNTVKTVRYFDNYRDTLIRIAKSLVGQYDFVWICSSICNYEDFDFSWHPEQWQATMLHVFASDEQKFGDTFFMHVPTFAEHAERRELLEWYDCNFVGTSVPRRPMPIVQHDDDSHVDVVQTHDFAGPLAIFSTGLSLSQGLKPPAVSLWREKTKTIVPLSPGANIVIVPKVAISHIKTQLYDYPNIDKTRRNDQIDQESDVIFISNGESMADANWRQLVDLCSRAQRSDGVTGREAAYKAAAQLSTTPWFFAVFAKTEVLPDFKFDYQPDRMQQSKHYIFHSKNPVNDLEYGAMNINLYNRQLVLGTQPGLDFTLSAAHEVVPICASISRFNTDPWVTWRSAFREVLKLQREVDQGADVEIQYRLNTWLTVAHGENAQWCLQGATDAARYYQSINGDYDGLKLSFDWAWLQNYYHSLYHQRPWLESV